MLESTWCAALATAHVMTCVSAHQVVPADAALNKAPIHSDKGIVKIVLTILEGEARLRMLLCYTSALVQHPILVGCGGSGLQNSQCEGVCVLCSCWRR